MAEYKPRRQKPPRPVVYRLTNPAEGEDPRVEIRTGAMLGNVTEARIMEVLELRLGSRLESVDHAARKITLK